VGNIEEAQEVLKYIGLPRAQQNEISALTLLALAGLTPDTSWSSATKRSLTISKGIMAFVKQHYNKAYAENTRETFRRQVLHQFMQANLVDYNPDEPGLPTNSPRAHYALTDEALRTIRAYGTKGWKKACRRFVNAHGALRDKYGMEAARLLVPVELPDGTTRGLSPGPHNVLQAAVVEEFGPRFAPGSRLLYLGDTARKDLYFDQKSLQALGIQLSEHDKLPDVILYDSIKRRLFLIEAVTSHGPMSPKRHTELEKMFAECHAKLIFVTAFPSFREFRKHMLKIAWETEVWIVEEPDHMIHYDGEKFLDVH